MPASGGDNLLSRAQACTGGRRRRERILDEDPFVIFSTPSLSYSDLFDQRIFLNLFGKLKTSDKRKNITMWLRIERFPIIVRLPAMCVMCTVTRLKVMDKYV